MVREFRQRLHSGGWCPRRARLAHPTRANGTDLGDNVRMSAGSSIAGVGGEVRVISGKSTWSSSGKNKQLKKEKEAEMYDEEEEVAVAVSVKRKSLADLQTNNNGVRRSNRQRVRPLEYWLGEKKVYSRKDAALPTVHHHVEVHLPDPMWPMPQQPKRRK
jgi:hypothetical protein